MTRALLAVIAALAACGSKAKKVTASATIVVELKPARALWYGASPPTITFPKIVTPGLVIGINNDQDSGSVDSSDNVVNVAADAAQMTSFIIKQRTATAVSGDRMHIVRKPGGGNVRVFRAGTGSTGILTTSTSLSTTSDADATAIMTALGTGDVELYVEGTSAGDVELCAAWTGSASDEQCAKFIVVDGYGAPTGYGPRIYGDTNRNGTLLASEDVAGHDKYTATTGAIAFPNIDKDCGSPDDAADTTIACAADEADIAHVRVDKPRMGTLPAGWKPVLRYVSSTQPRFHIFERATNGASELTGTWTTIDGVTFWQVDLSALSAWTAPGEMTLGLEGRALDVPADLPVDLFVCVTHVATMSDASCDRMQFRNSTALLQPNTETNVRVVVTDDPENVAMRNSMSSSMPASVALSAEAPGVNDQWFQDEIEILGIRAPRGGAQLVVQLPRYRGLSAWSSAQIGPNIANTSLKPTDLVGDSPQYGGNLECSPPSGADQGRIIIGDDMAPALVAGLRALAPLQSTIAISTRWLAVGHVDEVAAIFPKPGGGWGTTVGDPDAAKAILNGVQEKASLFWHCRTPTRTRAPECFGEGVTTSASAKTSGAPARLTANGFTFTRPSGREFQWLRIYKGRGQGQVARPPGQHERRQPQAAQHRHAQDRQDADAAGAGLGAADGRDEQARRRRE